jgi:hypothetical protein
MELHRDALHDLKITNPIILSAIYIYIYISLAVKVKFTLEQATKAHRGSRGIDLLFP